MIQQRSILKVSDNSGAKTVRCIKVIGGFKKKYAKIGDIIIVSVKLLRNKLKKNSKVKKGEVYKALLIRAKSKLTRINGINSYFNENAVALINKQGNPLGTRIIGPIPRVLKNKNFQKFVSISSGII